MERAKGIEPSYEAWEASVLPLNYARMSVTRRFLVTRSRNAYKKMDRACPSEIENGHRKPMVDLLAELSAARADPRTPLPFEQVGRRNRRSHSCGASAIPEKAETYAAPARNRARRFLRDRGWNGDVRRRSQGKWRRAGIAFGDFVAAVAQPRSTSSMSSTREAVVFTFCSTPSPSPPFFLKNVGDLETR